MNLYQSGSMGGCIKLTSAKKKRLICCLKNNVYLCSIIKNG